ncbi:hypothetical protein ABW20_dc0104902 [Dactylellina cionopaga]|nr:hypothetical protein ABW20_dc0104902 [Dactylellina cionopaga]
MNAPENAIAEIQDGETTHYICQDGAELTERSFDGELGPPELLGSALSYTPSTYLLLEDERRAFYCLNEDGALQDFLFDPEEGEWQPGQLAALGTKAAADAELAAVCTPDATIQLFFQSLDGAIHFLSCDRDGEWSAHNNLPSTDPSDGASLYSININGSTRVFYSGRDNFIHELVGDGEWADNTLAGTETASSKLSIAASPFDDNYVLQFTTAEHEVYAIQEGKKVLVGRYINGVFKKDQSAEGYNQNGPKVIIRTIKTTDKK